MEANICNLLQFLPLSTSDANVKKGDSNSEVIIGFVLSDLSVKESYNGFGIYLIRHCRKRFVELYCPLCSNLVFVMPTRWCLFKREFSCPPLGWTLQGSMDQIWDFLG